MGERVDLKTIADRFVECRDFGHSWVELIGNSELKDRNRVYRRLLRCERCGADRDELVFRKDGDVIKRAYRYPKGYLLPKNSGRYVRAAFRREAVERAIAMLMSKKGV